MDTFRTEYKKLSTTRMQDIEHSKIIAERLEIYIDKYASREASLAKTKLEECVMWLTKAITS